MTDPDTDPYKPTLADTASLARSLPRSYVAALRRCSIVYVFFVFTGAVAAYLWLYWSIGNDDWHALIAGRVAGLTLLVAALANLTIICLSSYCCIQYRRGFGYLAFSIIIPVLLALPFLAS